jgi:hypothetical protein
MHYLNNTAANQRIVPGPFDARGKPALLEAADLEAAPIGE